MIILKNVVQKFLANINSLNYVVITFNNGNIKNFINNDIETNNNISKTINKFIAIMI